MKTFRKTAPLLAASIALITGPALAGNVSEPVIEQVIAPAPVVAVGDWTGFYLGGQVGYGDASTSGTDYDGGSYGLHTGYLYDMGEWVVGGELDYDKTSFSADSGPGEIDEIMRAKLIGGYDLGQTLIYGTAGAFNANLSVSGVDTDDTGAFIGLGAKRRFTDNIVGGVEALYHQASDFGGVSGNDLDATTLTARVSYQF